VKNHSTNIRDTAVFHNHIVNLWNMLPDGVACVG